MFYFKSELLRFFGLILFIIFVHVVQSELNFGNDLENNKNFKSIPTTIKAFENDTVLLPCSLNTPFRYVRWHHDDTPLVDSRHPEILPPERVLLWANGSLQVSNVQSEDTGDYYCEIMSSDSHAVQVHAIEVQYSPTVMADPSGILELPLGAVFEMVCAVKGVPQPAITWRMNGETVNKLSVGNKQSHLFEVKSRSMAGPIDCLATNGVGQPAVAGVYLHVLFLPEVRASQTVVYTKVGMRAHLECNVEAAPSATVQWFHHGVPVPMDVHISSHETEMQSNRSTVHYVTECRHVLTIKKVRDADMGQYECRAQNQIGFTSVIIELTGRPMPCIFKINPGIQSSTSHALVWQTESLLPVMEFKLKFRQIPSGNLTKQVHRKTNWTELTIPAELTIGPIYITTYTLHGLQPASLFEVAVLARNSFGWSDNSKIVRFATGGEVELPNYSTESDLQYETSEEDDSFNDVTERHIIIASMVRGSASLQNIAKCYIFCGIVLVILFKKLFSK